MYPMYILNVIFGFKQIDKQTPDPLQNLENFDFYAVFGHVGDFSILMQFLADFAPLPLSTKSK